MRHNRHCGVLLHPTSLPSKYGIGELGYEAHRFIDFLEQSGMSIWQVLPLGPTGYGDSPYSSFSTFAGNPLLISLDNLVGYEDLSMIDLADRPDFPEDRIDYGKVIEWKIPKLRLAAENFLSHKNKQTRHEAYKHFCKSKKKWLDDFALFMALKEHFQAKAQSEGVDGAIWSNYWDEDIALRDPLAIKKWKSELKSEIEIQKVWQFFFFCQWMDLKGYANLKGIQIIGDIPIFVAPDSADVWAHRDIFCLDEKGSPSVVAGVPPDYFSATGQRWGNPLYDWDKMKSTGFKWWIERIEATLELVDIIRVDHFRGFEAYWEIPAEEKTAVKGRWVKALGKDLFTKVRSKLGVLPILAEDLGEITEEVIELRDFFGFPGMNVLQFAFEGSASDPDGQNPFLPHNHNPNAVVYTGSHDNDTTRGWYDKACEADRDHVKSYFVCNDMDVVWAFVRAAIASVCQYAIIPMQDLLNLESDCRMNLPGKLGGNWGWRMYEDHMHHELAGSIRYLVQLYGRLPE
ncbi:4-alpha-glucanotransferase [Spirochaeta cellobiosiphila]|uniref:4-alpha-glucanotransferase n=1 Tax=Spirochaeta cellobiosiphila TaxID=504483 RepID=UPI0003F81A42|nr:4-alpha-glucanotransferase [Spirochaeta cellobiosiphila]